MKTPSFPNKVQPLYGPLLFLFAIMFCSAIASADELYVKSFTSNPLDLSGAVNSRKDLNGNTCALLKIALPKESASVIFECNTIDTENDGSEIHVYMPTGTKIIFSITAQQLKLLG